MLAHKYEFWQGKHTANTSETAENVKHHGFAAPLFDWRFAHGLARSSASGRCHRALFLSLSLSLGPAL